MTHNLGKELIMTEDFIRYLLLFQSKTKLDTKNLSPDQIKMLIYIEISEIEKMLDVFSKVLNYKNKTN